MKKIILIFLSLTLICCMVGCKSVDIPDEAYNVACNALDTTNEFLNGEINADTAYNELDNHLILLDGYSETADLDAQIDISSIKLDIISIQSRILSIDDDTNSLNEIKEKRDDLADMLGK